MTRLRAVPLLAALALLSCRGKAERSSADTVDTTIALVAAPGDSAEPETAEPDSTIPVQFQGDWAGRQSQCGRPSESSLNITANSVNFYESRGKVLAVDVMKERVIEVLLEFSGEGGVRRLSRQFQLSEDGASLTDLTTQGHVVRVRCQPHL